MQVQSSIGFVQFLKIVRKLPASQLKRLKPKIEKQEKSNRSVDLEAFLFTGPIATKKQMEIISNNRKAINQWRTK